MIAALFLVAVVLVAPATCRAPAQALPDPALDTRAEGVVLSRKTVPVHAPAMTARPVGHRRHIHDAGRSGVPARGGDAGRGGMRRAVTRLDRGAGGR